jgi:hypothetical protein
MHKEVAIYQKGSDGAEWQCLVTTKKGIRGKSSYQCCKVGAAIEDVDNICSRNVFQVEYRSEIDQEIG